MQTRFTFDWWLYGGIALLLSSCFGLSRPTSLTEYSPIFLKRTALKTSVQLLPAQKIKDMGKIFQAGNYLFISEKYKGVHVIDNTNPTLPKQDGFISIPGCVDMAVKGMVLYVDNAIDLVCIDLVELKLGNLKITKRVESVFPEVAPPDGGRIPTKFNVFNRPENSIIIGWRK